MDNEKRGIGYLPIERHGMIGDLHTAALVGDNGTIDFLCFPRFDSPSIFAALLDDARGGHFSLAPVWKAPRLSPASEAGKQLYLSDSAILLTRFFFEQAVGEVSDYMPISPGEHAHDLVRRAKTVIGELTWRMECSPRFNYGRTAHRIEEQDGSVLFIPKGSGDNPVRLRSTVPMKIENGAAVAEFTLGAGRSVPFVLEQVQPGTPSLSASPDYVSSTFKETLNFWRQWVGRSKYQGRWREMVNRSAIVLKMLTYAPTGAIVAAPTFGLPEVLGGIRNWDYRYTWIRDASFSLYALMRLGYMEEAGAFMKWIAKRCEEHTTDDKILQIMYGIDGRRTLTEETLPHLEGYRGSSPVRVGNGAAGQLQLDVYGELMDSVYMYDKYGEPISHQLYQDLVQLLEWLAKNWNRKDEGIWEVRGGKRDFLYSRFLCWVAFDRALRLARRRSYPAPVEKWRRCRDDIYRQIFADFWNPQRKAFMQYKGADTLDASTLLMPLVKVISARDPLWLSTLHGIENHLVYDSLVYRYRIGKKGAVDKLVGKEGTFNMCSFWFVECLSRSGDIEQARFYFEKMLGYANHLGLYSEELGPKTEFLGNFPQAFTHLALISAAFDLNRRLSEAGQSG